MRRTIMLFAWLGSCAFVMAQQQSFEEWLKQDQAEFQQYKEEVTRQYEQFLKEEQEAFQAFVEQAGAKWGNDNVWVPLKKTWVQYTGDLDERSAVDFEDGTVQVQVLIDTDEEVSQEDINAALAEGVERVALSGTVGPIQMIKQRMFGEAKTEADPGTQRRTLANVDSFTSYRVQRGDTLWGMSRRFDIVLADLAKLNRMDVNARLTQGKRILVPYLPKDHSPVVVTASAEPVLKGQLKTASGQSVTSANAAAYARETVAGQTPKVETIKQKDGRTVQSATVQLKLAPDHLRVRAERYGPLVSRYAAKHSLHPSLVYAVMHTESAFNPRARSGAPAYGLMQLVPRSGARDAYQYVYKEDKLVSGAYLYDPKNNIELGTAFLHVLDSRYLKKIEHPKSRLYCVISAYNTGAGNVCKPFTGGTSPSRAAPIINRMEPEAVYARLRTDLPYEETRNYLKKVRDRMEMYR